jgi:hypothetical protein
MMATSFDRFESRSLVDPVKTWGNEAAKVVVEFGPQDDIRNRLKELNGMISGMWNSIFIGTTQEGTNFLKSKFIVQKAEYRFAFYPDTCCGRISRNHFDHPWITSY